MMGLALGAAEPVPLIDALEYERFVSDVHPEEMEKIGELFRTVFDFRSVGEPRLVTTTPEWGLGNHPVAVPVLPSLQTRHLSSAARRCVRSWKEADVRVE